MAAKGKLTPAQQKQILSSALGAIAFIAWVILFLAPQQRALGEKGAQIQDLRLQVGRLRQDLRQMPALEQELTRLKSQYQPTKNPLPPEEQLPELLATIAGMAQQSQVVLLGAKPTADVNKLAPGPSGYLELKILLILRGGFHPMAHFMDRLESSEELMRLREFSIVEEGDRNLETHLAILLLEAYLVPSSAMGPPPAPTSAPPGGGAVSG